MVRILGILINRLKKVDWNKKVTNWCGHDITVYELCIMTPVLNSAAAGLIYFCYCLSKTGGQRATIDKVVIPMTIVLQDMANSAIKPMLDQEFGRSILLNQCLRRISTIKTVNDLSLLSSEDFRRTVLCTERILRNVALISDKAYWTNQQVTDLTVVYKVYNNQI